MARLEQLPSHLEADALRDAGLSGGSVGRVLLLVLVNIRLDILLYRALHMLMGQLVVLDQALQTLEVGLVKVDVLLDLDVGLGGPEVMLSVAEVYGEVWRQW